VHSCISAAFAHPGFLLQMCSECVFACCYCCSFPTFVTERSVNIPSTDV